MLWWLWRLGGASSVSGRPRFGGAVLLWWRGCGGWTEFRAAPVKREAGNPAATPAARALRRAGDAGHKALGLRLGRLFCDHRRFPSFGCNDAPDGVRVFPCDVSPQYRRGQSASVASHHKPRDKMRRDYADQHRSKYSRAPDTSSITPSSRTTGGLRFRHPTPTINPIASHYRLSANEHAAPRREHGPRAPRAESKR